MIHIENLTVNLTPDQLLNVDKLWRTAEVLRSAFTSPKIGAYWLGQGGIYAGVCRGRDGEADYPLILCEIKLDEDFTWEAALEKAKTIEVDGHKDFTVPTRWESALLYANLQDQFDTTYTYWANTQYSESHAFIQYFGIGVQHFGSKDYERRVCFVRRVLGDSK